MFAEGSGSCCADKSGLIQRTVPALLMLIQPASDSSSLSHHAETKQRWGDRPESGSNGLRHERAKQQRAEGRRAEYEERNQRQGLTQAMDNGEEGQRCRNGDYCWRS